jgi:hypothetical protein
MIPYDELVETLAQWRAKQGLSSRPASGRSAAPTADERPAYYAAVPETDFQQRDGTGEIDLDRDVVDDEV